MATLKKKRQRKTMEVRKALGVSLAFARQIAREIIDSRYILTPSNLLNHPEFVSTETVPNSCTCCSDRYVFRTKKGVLNIDQFGYFSFDVLG